jgi:NADH-quinone oxidoreductase subunit N
MFILVSSGDLGGPGAELLPPPVWLIAWQPHRPGAIEGGLKYAAHPTAAAFFCMALIYGSGTLSTAAIAAAMGWLLPVCCTGHRRLLLVGIGFELAVVQFHMWAADIYQGAPVPVTALLGTVAKVAMLVFLSRLIGEQMVLVWAQFLPLLAALAAAGMVVGNLLALRQQNLKRLLGYSTIVHFGYVWPPSRVARRGGYRRVVRTGLRGYEHGRVRGGGGARQGGRRPRGPGLLPWPGAPSPWLGLVLAIGVLSLAGLPPTAGFFAKLRLPRRPPGRTAGLAVLLALATAAVLLLSEDIGRFLQRYRGGGGLSRVCPLVPDGAGLLSGTDSVWASTPRSLFSQVFI